MNDFPRHIRTIGDCLLMVISQRKQTSHSTYFRPTRQDYIEAEIMSSGLSEKGKQLCMDYVQPNTDYQEQLFIQNVLAYQLPNADYIFPYTSNTPVAQLLEAFTDRHSKRVCAARKELIKRYPYLDEPDRSAFRLALLASSTKADRMAGLDYFMHINSLSDNDYQAICHLWQQMDNSSDAKLWYATCRLMIRHSDTAFLLRHQKSLCQQGNHAVNPRLYYYLCLRLGDQSSFEIQKEWLSIEDYYRLVVHHSLMYNEAEWTEDFYRIVADVHASKIYPCLVSVPAKDREQWNGQEQRWMQLMEIDRIRRMLLYGSQLDLVCAMSGLAYCRLVDSAVEIGEHQPDVLYDFCPDCYQNLFKRDKN